MSIDNFDDAAVIILVEDPHVEGMGWYVQQSLNFNEKLGNSSITLKDLLDAPIDDSRFAV